MDVMDEDEQDVYVAQLHEVFDSCDRLGKGSLDRIELIELCKKLQLDDQVPQLLQQLLGSEDAEGQVTFDDFKEGFVAVLSQAIDALSSSEDEAETTTEHTEPPKYVRGEKRYGRKSKPDTSYSEDIYSADDESLVESRPPSASSSRTIANSTHEDLTDTTRHREERPGKLTRKISSRASSLRSSIRRHNSKKWQQRVARNDSTLSQDDVEILETSTQMDSSHGSVATMNNSGYESPSEEEQLKAIWSEVNVGANGYLNYHELALVCDHIGMDSMNEQELTLLFEELDEDGDGKVSFNEFLHGLFAAKDHYEQEVIKEELVEVHQSTPVYGQPPSGTGRNMNTSRVDDLFLTRTGGTTSSFDLLSVLDTEGTGMAKVEDVKELWTAQELHEAIPILEHVDTDAEGKISLHQLTDLLESLIQDQSDGLSKAAVGIYKHEAALLRSHMDQLTNERDALRDNIVKLTDEKEMLIAESEDTTRQLERIHEGKIKDTESSFIERMQTLQHTMAEEREKDLLNATQHRSLLEDSLKNTKSEETRLKEKLMEAEEEILRLEKNLAEAQEKLNMSEMTRERLEKEIDSMSDLSGRLADLEKQQLLKQQQNRNANKSVRELERINRELRDENDELRLQVEGLTAQVNSSVKRRPSHRKRQGSSDKVHRMGSVLSDYTKPKVIRRNKDGATSSEESANDEVDAAGTGVPVRLSGDGGSNEDGENDTEREHHRKEIERLEGKVQELSDALSEHEGSIKERDTAINNLKNEIETLRSSLDTKEEDTRQRYEEELSNLTSQFTGEIEGLQKTFVTEKDELERQYQAQISDLEESLRSEKDVLSQDLEGSFSQIKEMLISEYEAEKAELETEHRGEKTMLETFFNSQLEEAKANFNEEKDKLREKLHALEEEKAEAELKFLNEKAAMEQQFRIDKSEWELSSSSSKAEHQKNQRDWDNLRTDLEKSHREQVHALESEYRKDKSKREEDFDNQLWELKQEHSKEVAGLKQNVEQLRAELEQQLSRIKSEMREAHAREKSEMQQKFNREQSELKELLEKEFTHNLAVQEADLRKEFLQEKSDVEKSLSEEKYKIEEDYRSNYASNEMSFQKWKSEVEEHFTEEKAKLIQSSAREKAEIEQKYLDEITVLRQAFSEGEAGLKGQLKDDFLLLLSQHKADLEDSYAREKAQLEESYFREKAELQRSGLVEANEIKESYNREKSEMEESYKRKIKELQENFAREKDAIESEYLTEKEDLRSELESEFTEKIQSENGLLEQTVKHLQDEINYLKEQKKELETKVQSLELKTLSRDSLDLRVAREKINNLEDRVEKLERERVRLLEENDEFKVKMDELENEKVELAESALEKQRQLLKAEETKHELQSVERKLEEVTSKKNVVDNLLREKNATCSDLQEDVYKLKEKLANMENSYRREMETEKQRVMVANTEMATVKSRCQRESTELRDQLHRANLASERDQALREKVFNEAKAEVMSLNKKLEEKTRRLRELESAGNLWESRIRDLDKNKQELTQQLIKTREALDEHVARLSKELQQKDMKCLRSDTLVTELYMENAKLMKALAQTEASEKKAEKSNRQLMEQKRALQRVISKLCGANAIA